MSIIRSRGDALQPPSNVSRDRPGFRRVPARPGLFLELLACEGGCVNGPPRPPAVDSTAFQAASNLAPGASGARRASARARGSDSGGPITAAPPVPPRYPEAQVREALRLVGKNAPQDELNCGGVRL